MTAHVQLFCTSSGSQPASGPFHAASMPILTIHSRFCKLLNVMCSLQVSQGTLPEALPCLRPVLHAISPHLSHQKGSRQRPCKHLTRCFCICLYLATAVLRCMSKQASEVLDCNSILQAIHQIRASLADSQTEMQFGVFSVSLMPHAFQHM